MKHLNRKGSRSGATPLIAFLLVASFGILFAGCSSTVKGPNDEAAMEDDTFTADDVARFRDLSGDDSDSSGEQTSSLPRLDVAASNGAANSAATTAIDPALAAQYAAIRTVASGQSGYRVNNEFLNIRATPSTGGAFVARLERGDAVTVMEFVNATWAKVKLADGNEGYASAQYLAKSVHESDLEKEKKAFENVYFVDYKFVNMRAEPNVASAKLGEIPGGTFVRPLSVDADWAKVNFEGKDGYVSMQFLSLFEPNFVVRQDSFTLPILHYHVGEPGMLPALVTHAQRLKQDGVKLITLRDFFDLLLVQEVRDTRLQPGRAVIALSGVTPQNVQEVSGTLTRNGIPATIFLQTQHVGVSGISQKSLLTLQANGFDVQSGGHTGDDLRALTNAQLALELAQSRTILEDATNKTVFAVAYPQGGSNDRVLQAVVNAGYLMGLSNTPSVTFARDQLLRLPSLTITSSMTADDISQSIR